ncbi:MAG TPA: cobyrinate a,c-diamide synthase [Candidatus Binataceae bacterium]|nr:cobyrinate a,c-diamide synthase [Candidatus Binataceae bacterium]HVA69333.1 cobyrinate a,c-diamide synthase [Candidatus Binataceae bacterium]
MTNPGRIARRVETPRIVVSAPSSGVGKTTVTLGLIGALKARGFRVAAFKCGPDYLDPTYHRRATGSPSHNLDGWMMGREAVLATFARASHGADVAVIEGMMGLFDGTTPRADEGSTAEIAKWLGAPVMLVVDASGMARSIAAVARGFASFDPALRLAGIVANRIGGRGHLQILTEACEETRVLGGFPESAGDAFPERHLGLLRADENALPDARLAAWSATAAQWLDLDAIIEIAKSAGAIELAADSVAATVGGGAAARCRIGIADDDAFHFYYAYNLASLEAAGAELVRFSPAHDQHLPAADGLYFGGGYPEACAAELSANHAMIDAIRAFAAAGRPIYAECGGLMYLARAIRTPDGKSWPMAEIVPGEAVMGGALAAIGYVEVETNRESIIGPAGTRFRGHQFRYSALEDAGEKIPRIYTASPRWGGAAFNEGFSIGNVLASYIHAHWASNPAIAARFVEACVRARSGR